MRRVNYKFDEDDYNNYDDDEYYDEDEYYEEDYDAQHGYQVPIQEPPPQPKPARQQQQQQQFVLTQKSTKKGKGGGKKGGTTSPSKKPQAQEQQYATPEKVFQISNLVEGARTDVIKKALEANLGDVEKAADQLLQEIADQVEIDAAATEGASVKSPVVLSIGSVKKTAEEPKVQPKSIAATTKVSSAPAPPPQAVPKKKKGGKADPLESFVPVKIDEEEDSEEKPNLNLVVVGHVDAGKSTLMGHLLYQLKYVSQREMHKFEKEAKEVGKGSFAFAWVLDEHEDERERGVTVDVGIKYFETEHRRITLLDAPGHRDFIPNMITGAVQGDVAVLVVPGNPDEFESSFQHNGQTREHAILVRYCGIRKLVVAINKMDMCDWSKGRFDEVAGELERFLLAGGYAKEDITFVPVSGLAGLNLTQRLEKGIADWYDGPSLIEYIDNLAPSKRPVHKPFRMVVADVFKTILLGPFTVSGKIESGVIQEGDRVRVLPTCPNILKVKAIQRHRGKEVFSSKYAKAGDNVELGLVGDIEDNMITSSSVVCDVKFPIPVVKKFVAEITTMEQSPIILKGFTVQLHIQNFHVSGYVSKLISVDQPGGKGKKANPRFLRKNQTATVEITANSPVCIEKYTDFRPLSRILLRQRDITVAAGRCIDL